MTDDPSLDVLALVIACIGVAMAAASLLWQVLKHFLDGGRVKVQLNIGVWHPGRILWTNHEGQLKLEYEDVKKRGLDFFEVGQLVVENPTRTPVTIHSSGLFFTGTGHKNHTSVPVSFEAGDLGADSPTTDQVVRLEPYDRVSYLFEFWPQAQRAFTRTESHEIEIRGYTRIAGRGRKNHKSSRHKRWRVNRDEYTALGGLDKIAPFTVIWRHLYLSLPKKYPGSGRFPVHRDDADYLLRMAMARFNERPPREDLDKALREIRKTEDFDGGAFGLALINAYEELDRLDDNLDGWLTGIPQLLVKGARDQTEDSALGADDSR
ncbi:hypothetical protein ACHABX_08720 [Nesterenkonia halotolerans]|uniref:hypothetical protein n=1 Tax=Nesterenkonia halotolerans TaxID=225325 RepID=UPI003EE5C77E